VRNDVNVPSKSMKKILVKKNNFSSGSGIRNTGFNHAKVNETTNVASIVDPDPVRSIAVSMIRIRKKSFWIKIRAALDPK
jgi:hypothetical protein